MTHIGPGALSIHIGRTAEIKDECLKFHLLVVAKCNPGSLDQNRNHIK